MKLTIQPQDIHRTVMLCIKESMCTYGDRPHHARVCPIYEEGRSFTSSPGGLVYLVRAILEGKMDYSASLAELAFTCTGCGACEKFCELLHFPEPHVGPWEIIRLLRSQLVKRGFVPEGEVKALYEAFKEGRASGESRKKTLGTPGTDQKGAAQALFVECLHRDAQKEAEESALRLLAKAGQTVAHLAGEECCGSTLYDLGFWDRVEEVAQGTWEKMKDFGDKEIVFTNPHCQEFVVKRYPEILPDYKKIKARHISEVLADALKTGKLTGKKFGKAKVSYHDPCYLGRGLGIYDAPREALTSLPGVELVEMEGNRVDSFCCGARATGNYFPDFPVKTAGRRLQAFTATGAELLITACPYCKQNFQRALPEKEKGKVKDLAEFVEERTGQRG